MSTTCKGKSSWPELVGKAGKEAEKIIEKENTVGGASIVDEGAMQLLHY